MNTFIKFLLVCLLGVIGIYSQEISSEIKVEKNSFSITLKNFNTLSREEIKGKFRVIDYYEFTDELNPGTYKLPTKNLIIAIPPNTTPTIEVVPLESHSEKNSIPKLNPRIKLQADSSLKYFDLDFVKDKNYPKDKLYEIKGYLWVRDVYCIHIKINLVQYDDLISELKINDKIKINLIFAPNVIISENQQQILSIETNKQFYDIIINKEMVWQFLGKPNYTLTDTTGNWIDYNAAYVKIGTVEDRIYRLYKTDLEQIGISTSTINPKHFKLFKEGLEIPILVNGEEDGTFDAQDFIEFWGQKNYNKISARVINVGKEPYNNYLNPFTDTSYYFLTWNQGNGKRIFTDTTFQYGLTDTLNYYNCLIHNEIDNANIFRASTDNYITNDPEDQSLKFYGYSFFSSTMSVSFSVSDLIGNKSAKAFAKIVSSASSVSQNSHNISLKINNNLIDSLVANLNDRILIGKPFNSNLLNNAANTLLFTNHPNGISPNQLIWDWSELEYPRKIKALNDSLFFEMKDSIAQSFRVIKVENVSSNDFICYRVKPTLKRIINYKKVGTNLFFCDTVGFGTAYFVMKTNSYKPHFIRQKQFVNLRSTNRAADYIGITNSILKSGAAGYLNSLSTLYSYKFSLVLIDDIYDEFCYGEPRPAVIKNFLKTAYNNWSAPKPKYVTFIGSACYDYKKVFYYKNNYEMNVNLVPSYGEPVSDTWFTIWDTTGSLLQQLFVGRITAKTSNDINYYLQKHRDYLAQRLNIWNKRTILFSGGNGSDSSQLALFKNTHQSIINDYILPAPLSLYSDHFYKTQKPYTDFGPYEPLYVLNSIAEGGVFISYIGHSGTRNWDNSIADPKQLANKYNKGQLNTDFGCSTNKFAEPDIDAFGTILINVGQAIGYIGNSSLGFTSTAVNGSNYFYETLLKDSIRAFGESHYAAKLKLFNRIGTTGVNRIFALTNLLAGDPIISLALPQKPNLTIIRDDVYLASNNFNEEYDSLKINFSIDNYGTTSSDSFKVIISDRYNDSITFTKEHQFIIPEFKLPCYVNIPIKNKSGEHKIKIKLDVNNNINEIYEDDNEIEYAFIVPTTALKLLIEDKYTSKSNSTIKILNSIYKTSLLSQNILTEIDSTSLFTNPTRLTIPLDTFYTKAAFNNLLNGKRYWIRARLNKTDTIWSKISTFLKDQKDFNFIIKDSLGFVNQSLSDVETKNGIILQVDTITIQVVSAGGNFNKYGAIYANGINVLPNTFSWGMGIAVFDDKTFKLDTAQTFWYGDWPAGADSLANLINRVPNGKIVVMNAIDDAGSNLNGNLKIAIKTLGSIKVDNIGRKMPWVLIGIKGAVPGNVIEILKPNTYMDYVTADTIYYKQYDSGKVITTILSNSSKWKQVEMNASIPSGSSILVYPIGIKNSGLEDTLSVLNFINNVSDISSIKNVDYPSLKFLITMKNNSLKQSPIINSFAVDYSGLPELGTNYQTQSILKDTFNVGDNLGLKFFVVNAGEITADSIKVQVEEVLPNNYKKIIWQSNIDSLPKESKKVFQVNYIIGAGPQQRVYLLSIDPGNKINEYFKDNNNYSIPVYIKADTSKANVNITFDGQDIINGDFVSVNPKIKVEVNDFSLLPITDTSFISLYLDDNRIFLPDSNYVFSNSNPKVTVTYSPTLIEGEHYLKVMAKDASGYLIDSLGFEKSFFVKKDAQLLYVYNYPNPFKDNTYFTFKISQIPDELKIKLFTVAGRLIKEINVPSSQLNYDFNRIPWDGRDDDGNLIANGIYFYKIILSKNGKTETTTQKIAIFR